MNILKDIDAVWFDAFWTLIDTSNTPKKSIIINIFKKYWLDIRGANLMTEQYTTNIEEYYEELFYTLFEIEWRWRSYNNDIEKRDKEKLIQTLKKEYSSYKLRDQTEELLNKIKKEVDFIFVISNLSSPYTIKVKELLKWQGFLFKTYSCEVWFQKTIKETRIFDISSEILNRKSHLTIPKKRILFTWDNIANDVKASENAWMKAIEINKLREIILNS